MLMSQSMHWNKGQMRFYRVDMRSDKTQVHKTSFTEGGLEIRK